MYAGYVSVKAIGERTPDEDLLVALANTGHGDTDELADAASAERWCRSLRLAHASTATRPGTAADLAALRSARDLVRVMTLRNNGVAVEADTGLLAGTPLQFAWEGGPTLRAPGATSLPTHVTGAALLALVRASGRPDWARVKACRGPDCAWVFIDRSRNGSRRWCQMSECGNRAKAAAFRARSRESARH